MDMHVYIITKQPFLFRRKTRNRFFSVAVLLWNNLPSLIRTARTITCFRKLLKHIYSIWLSALAPRISEPVTLNLDMTLIMNVLLRLLAQLYK